MVWRLLDPVAPELDHSLFLPLTLLRKPTYGNCDRDIYALVAELAGGLKDDEAMAEDIIDTLISLIPGFESRASFAPFGRGGKDV